jgi:hypothetical protein
MTLQFCLNEGTHFLNIATAKLLFSEIPSGKKNPEAKDHELNCLKKLSKSNVTHLKTHIPVPPFSYYSDSSFYPNIYVSIFYLLDCVNILDFTVLFISDCIPPSVVGVALSRFTVRRLG